MKKTNQIIIKIPKGKDGYPLFEKIQNDFSLYDNCVIDTDDDGTQKIRIEGKSLTEIIDLSRKLLKDYVEDLRVAIVPMEDTIVDVGRDVETGGLEV